MSGLFAGFGGSGSAVWLNAIGFIQEHVQETGLYFTFEYSNHTRKLVLVRVLYELSLVGLHTDFACVNTKVSMSAQSHLSACVACTILLPSVCALGTCMWGGFTSSRPGPTVCLHLLTFRGDLQSLCWPARTRRKDRSQGPSSSSLLVRVT